MISLAHCRRILEAAATKHGLPPMRLINRTRDQLSCRARLAAMLAMHELGASTTRIGAAIDRNPSTCSDGVKRAKELAEHDAYFRALVDELGGVE